VQDTPAVVHLSCIRKFKFSSSVSGKLIINNAGFRDKDTYKLLHHSSTNKLLLVYGLYHQSEVRYGISIFSECYSPIKEKADLIDYMVKGQHCVFIV